MIIFDPAYFQNEIINQKRTLAGKSSRKRVAKQRALKKIRALTRLGNFGKPFRWT